ncbi:amino acid ABC transporter ATP-binding protein [Leucobacter sp. HY1910]
MVNKQAAKVDLRVDDEVMVGIERVSKSYGSLQVLHDVSLDVARGQVVCIIGPSGSGKSTLLNCVNHLESIDGGSIHVGGEYIGYRRDEAGLHELSEFRTAKQRRHVGMVFQQFNLFPHLTVRDNVSFAQINVLGRRPQEAHENSARLLERVGLGDKGKVYPQSLSGGQQQRVAIARALALGPEVMLFDEPTSALDPELVDDVLVVMKELARSGMTMLVVTHELGFAREVADVVVFMADGRIVETGSPQQVLENPVELRTQQFISRIH